MGSVLPLNVVVIINSSPVIYYKLFITQNQKKVNSFAKMFTKNRSAAYAERFLL